MGGRPYSGRSGLRGCRGGGGGGLGERVAGSRDFVSRVAPSRVVAFVPRSVVVAGRRRVAAVSLARPPESRPLRAAAWRPRSACCVRSSLRRASNGERSRSAGPNTSTPLDGACLSAVVQSVGAGCCAAGTPRIQMRHLPAGGIMSLGTSAVASAAGARLAGARVAGSVGLARFACATASAGTTVRTRSGTTRRRTGIRGSDEETYPAGTGVFSRRNTFWRDPKPVGISPRN